MPRNWLLWLLFVYLTSAALGQAAGDLASEPHYHLLFQNDQVRVFALTLKPYEQAYVRHDHNFLMITLQDCEIVMWSEGESPIKSFQVKQGDVHFFLGMQASGLRNDRATDYRNITVEFLGSKVTSYGYQYQSGTWDYSRGGINPPVDPHAKFIDPMLLGAANVADVQLLAGDWLPPPQKEAEELMVPVTDVDLKLGERHIRRTSGEATWMGAGRKSDLVSAGGGAVRFVMVELRTMFAK